MIKRLDKGLAVLDVATEYMYNTIRDIVKNNAGFIRIVANDFCTCKAIFHDEILGGTYEESITAVGVFCNDLCILTEDISEMSDAEAVDSDNWQTIKHGNMVEIIALHELAITLQNMGF